MRTAMAESTWEHITGGWAGLLQGGIGSLVGTLLGVIGAFYVALWTTRHELQRDRDNVRDQARISAAGNLGPVLHEMAAHLEQLNGDRILNDQSWASRRISAWNELKGRLTKQMTVDALILPSDIQAHLKAVEDRVDDAYFVTEHEHPQAPPFFEPGHDDKILELREAIDTSVDALNRLQVAIYNPVTRVGWWRRLGVVWTITGTAGLAVVVLALVLILS